MYESLKLTESELVFLEVPLDSFVGKGIIEDYKKIGYTKLKWDKIKTLKPNDSDEYQECARAVVKRLYGIDAPVELDLIYWRRQLTDDL